MDFSAIGEAVLKAREGRRLKAYRDSVGVWTIGYGHTTAAGGLVVVRGLVITDAQCDAIFHADVQKYVAAVRAGLKRQVPQNAFDALVSICYNIGPGAFARSTFLKYVNAGDMEGARTAILMWRKPAVIVTRRQAEVEQFITPYSAGLPRATVAKGSKPVRVAAPIEHVLGADVATPAIVPVAPPVSPFPNWLQRVFAFIDDTFGEASVETANDNAMPAPAAPKRTRRKAA